MDEHGCKNESAKAKRTGVKLKEFEMEGKMEYDTDENKIEFNPASKRLDAKTKTIDSHAKKAYLSETVDRISKSKMIYPKELSRRNLSQT